VAQGLVNAFNLFTDIFLLVLPMPVLLQLHTSFRKKGTLLEDLSFPPLTLR
jgi:hypothetical protein